MNVKFKRIWIILLMMCASSIIFSAVNSKTATSQNLKEVERILNFQGQMDEGALVVKFPRKDISVTVNNEVIPTAYGLVSWTAWKEMGKKMMVMGDLTLLEEEVNPVISVLEEAGIEVTAVHNHFLNEQPRVMYMHINGMGEAKKLADGIKGALDKTGTLIDLTSTDTVSPPAIGINTKKMEEIIGHTGVSGGGTFKITIGRPGVKMNGVKITSSMGMNTWISFIGTDDSAHVLGDIVMTGSEVNKVIKALSEGGINIASVHNHMLTEQPRVFFLHYWGTGPAEELAKTMKKALDFASGPIH